MPETFTWDEVQPKERFTFEDAQESPVQEGVSLAEHQQLEADWEKKFPKQPSPGFFKSAGRAIDESLKSTAGGVQLPLATDEELADHLQTELAGLQREEAPKLAGKAGSIAGSLVGTYGQALVTSRLGKGGIAAQFASQGAYDAFMHAGMRALVEGKDVNEAVSIGRKAALAGAAVGAGTGLLLKGRIPDWRTAVRESLKLGAAGAGGRVAQNVTERALGLKTPITEGAVEQGIVMGALPAAGFVTPRLLKAPQTMRDWYEANVNAVREVPMPPTAGPEVPIDAEITSPRGLIPDVPRQLPAPSVEPTPPPRPPSLLDIEEQLRNAPKAEPTTFTFEEATQPEPASTELEYAGGELPQQTELAERPMPERVPVPTVPLITERPRTSEELTTPSPALLEIRRRNDQIRAERDAFVNANLSVAGLEGGVEMISTENPNRKIIITPDIQQSGKWRTTYIDEIGPSGHNVFDSREAAIRAMSGESHTKMVVGPSYKSVGEFKVSSVRKPLAAQAKTQPKVQEPSAITPESSSQIKTTPKEQKAYLLEHLDEAIEKAPEELQSTPTLEGDADLALVKERAKKTRDSIAGLEPLFEKYGVKAPYVVEYKVLTGETKRDEWTPSMALNQLEGRIESAIHRSKDHVVIKVPGDGTFAISNRKADLIAFRDKVQKRFPATTTKPEQYTPRRLPTPSTVVKVVKSPTQKEVFDAAEMAVSTDPELEQIRSAYSNGKELVATDGRRLLRFVGSVPGTQDAPVIIKNGKVSKAEPVEGKTTIFPDYTQVIPKDRRLIAGGVDLSKLANSLKQAETLQKEGKTEDFKLYRNPDGSLGITARNVDVGEMSHNVNPDAAYIATYSLNYFPDVITIARKLGNEKVDIYSSEISGSVDLAPLVITGKNFEYVLMPMRGDGGSITGKTITAESLPFQGDKSSHAKLPPPIPPKKIAIEPEPPKGKRGKGIARKARENLRKPLGGEEGAVNLGAIGDALERNRQAILSLGRSVPNRHIMDQTFDAADTLAAVSGQQARSNISIGTTPIERDAAMAVVEAQGNRARLTQFLAQAQAGRNARAERAVRYAQANWGALQPLAGRVKARLDAQIAHEQYAGINTEYREGYIPHLYDTDLWMGSGRPYVLGKSGGGVASGFKKGRAFDTIFDAIEAGYVPKSMDVGELVEHRVKVGQRMINRRLWAEALRSINDPSDGNPIVTSMVHRSRGPGKAGYDVAPTGYSPREILPGITVAVHEGYTPLFDALTGTSKVSANAAGYLALKAAGGIKHGLLLFDTYHMGRIWMRQLFLTGKPSWTKGVSLLEYDDADLNRAVNEHLITPEIANWVRANRSTAQLLIRNGLNVGRIQEALYTSFVRDTPGLKQTVGAANKWIFEKLTRGAMMESALIEYERVRAAMPSLSDEEVARRVARDLNVYFGNIGSQGLLKSKTYQDLSRLVGLAPQWVESMAWLEGKGAVQAVKGLTYDPAVHRRILIGSLGKGLAQGILAMFIGAQILNLVTRKKPTWENPEKGHKLDAWIPDVTGKTPGFFLSPLSVQAELTHDFIRYNEAEPSGSKLKVAARIAQNKASPYTRALKVLATGRDWNNQQLISDWERVKAAAWALNPTPIPFSSPLNRNAPPGSLQRQLTASMGLKTEPAPRAGQQIFNLVNEWMKDNKDPKVRHEWERQQAEQRAASDYKGLTQALVADDPKKAAAEYQKLIDLKKTPERIIQHFQPWGHRFTGSSTANEEKFKKTLTPEQMKIYNAAIDERKVLWNKFQALRKQLAH